MLLQLPLSVEKTTPLKKDQMERDRLYKKVGQLQIEVDWLKKKTGYLGERAREDRLC